MDSGQFQQYLSIPKFNDTVMQYTEWILLFEQLIETNTSSLTSIQKFSAFKNLAGEKGKQLIMTLDQSN